MTRIAELQDRLRRLAKRREGEGIYTDAAICEEAAEALSRTGAVKAALSGDTGELIDRMAAAIRDWGSHYDDGPWETLPEDRKAGWRGDAERALAVVKEYLTARRPAEQAVTEAMVEALRNIDAEAPAKEPRDDWTSTDLDEAFYEGKLRGFWEMAVYAREALTAALGAQTPPEGAVTGAQGWRDMASAPRDGSMVLVASNRTYPAVQPARWRGTEADASSFQYWDACHHWFQDDDLLGWQPLPTPPVNQSEGAE